MRRRTVQRDFSGRMTGATTARFALIIIGAFVFVSSIHADDKVDQSQTTFVFKKSGVEITSEFPGGRMSDCRQVDAATFAISIRPENSPVNDSPWYAFQVNSEKPRTVRLRLTYETGSHRYWPKVSDDGQSWRRLDESKTRSLAADDVEFELKIDSGPVWVAAQEMLSLENCHKWCETLARKPAIVRSVLGYSLQGRAIDKLEIGDAMATNRVFIISRQHPPEVSGAIGMRHFVETIAGSSELARRFRRSFLTVVVPVVNPDGVAGGHWRHNAAGVDLNRDWGPFHQRETRALRDELLAIKSDRDHELRLFLDFHSTYEDVFYTQPKTAVIRPAKFTSTWLTAVDNRFPDYAVRRNEGHNVDLPTSKHWVHKTFGVPAITYEFGDETDRGLIREIASAAAEEMMRLMLQSYKQPAAPATSAAQ